MDNYKSIFDIQAEVGLTKQIGGLKATEELVELCHIGRGKYVLDVGCGVGLTACYLAKTYGCRVVGVDIREKMIDWSNERARKEGVEDRVEFRVADAQDLPFEDDLFDVVICESVVALVQDKQRVVNELARVTKPGGYVGLNESTWIKTPVPTEWVELLASDLSDRGQTLTSDGWVGLLEGAGLGDIVARIHETDARSESSNFLRRYGLGELLRISSRSLSRYLRSPAYRKIAKEAANVPKNLLEYMGYGIYVGRK
ncbi:MAG: methyltransferase domain-containing protein [Anaerolineales bacterium]|nr:methyltransferase domain-containing protein [Anaerolineales bacterium]